MYVGLCLFIHCKNHPYGYIIIYTLVEVISISLCKIQSIWQFAFQYDFDKVQYAEVQKIVSIMQ